VVRRHEHHTLPDLGDRHSLMVTDEAQTQQHETTADSLRAIRP
jgi:hypothetical protein